jgi:hypothetical protein
LRWKLRVLQGNESPARCVRKHFSFSLEVLVLDEMKDVIEIEFGARVMIDKLADKLAVK